MKFQYVIACVLLGVAVAENAATPSEHDAHDVHTGGLDIDFEAGAAADLEARWNDGGKWSHKFKCPKRWDSCPFYRNPKSECSWANNVIGNFFDCPKFDTVPLYSLVNYRTWDRFYTTNPWERNQAIWNWGYKSEGVAGYIFPNQWCGGVPLFRLYCWRSQQHFYTTSWEEKQKAEDLGYVDQGITGFIFLP
ncbi:hypothetical protein LshimejAT787_1204740 [Lyophyllum shimeji]|uniref:DUF5648 domain-containing protein n=1 Tax=Lyophyllum shimeji TaxID=47721 RepID=A0A9P3PVZ1_LYOSH|nr:hypothetical protein LshimejAT787_1204740 [Lyophyllum shimeji]